MTDYNSLDTEKGEYMPAFLLLTGAIYTQAQLAEKIAGQEKNKVVWQCPHHFVSPCFKYALDIRRQ